MFQGFSDETFEFFMAIRFNNNRDFFQANRDWYLRAVREPCLRLAEALIPVMEDIDPDLETRPWKVVSRINRDIRFSRDKSPYRDYMWLGYRHPGVEKSGTIGLYFDISATEGSSYGMGFYGNNLPLMRGFRRRLLQDPAPMRAMWRGLAGDFLLHTNTIKRLKVPETIPEDLRPWYSLRSFYLTRRLPDFALLKSPALEAELARGFARLKPLYQYFQNITPEEDEPDA